MAAPGTTARPRGKKQDAAKEHRPERDLRPHVDLTCAAPQAKSLHEFARREGADTDEKDNARRIRHFLVRHGHHASIADACRRIQPRPEQGDSGDAVGTSVLRWRLVQVAPAATLGLSVCRMALLKSAQILLISAL
jgi:hypothetical protein